jgi:hypothetical protein
LRPSSAGKPKAWGGHVALPREIHQLPDGSLGTRLPSRLLERIAGLPWKRVPDVTITPRPQVVDAAWEQLGPDFAAEFELRMPPDVRSVRLQIASLGEVALGRAKLRILDTTGKPRSELAVEAAAARAVPVRLFVDANMVEAFVDERHSLVARLPARPGPRRLTIRGDGKGAGVSAMRISALRWPDPGKQQH